MICPGWGFKIGLIDMTKETSSNPIDLEFSPTEEKVKSSSHPISSASAAATPLTTTAQTFRHIDDFIDMQEALGPSETGHLYQDKASKKELVLKTETRRYFEGTIDGQEYADFVFIRLSNKAIALEKLKFDLYRLYGVNVPDSTIVIAPKQKLAYQSEFVVLILKDNTSIKCRKTVVEKKADEPNMRFYQYNEEENADEETWYIASEKLPNFKTLSEIPKRFIQNKENPTGKPLRGYYESLPAMAIVYDWDGLGSNMNNFGFVEYEDYFQFVKIDPGEACLLLTPDGKKIDEQGYMALSDPNGTILQNFSQFEGWNFKAAFSQATYQQKLTGLIQVVGVSDQQIRDTVNNSIGIKYIPEKNDIINEFIRRKNRIAVEYASDLASYVRSIPPPRQLETNKLTAAAKNQWHLFTSSLQITDINELKQLLFWAVYYNNLPIAKHIFTLGLISSTFLARTLGQIQQGDFWLCEYSDWPLSNTWHSTFVKAYSASEDDGYINFIDISRGRLFNSKDPNLSHFFSDVLLHRACLNNNIDMAVLLINHGAPFNFFVFRYIESPKQWKFLQNLLSRIQLDTLSTLQKEGLNHLLSKAIRSDRLSENQLIDSINMLLNIGAQLSKKMVSSRYLTKHRPKTLLLLFQKFFAGHKKEEKEDLDKANSESKIEKNLIFLAQENQWQHIQIYLNTHFISSNLFNQFLFWAVHHNHIEQVQILLTHCDHKIVNTSLQPPQVLTEVCIVKDAYNKWYRATIVPHQPLEAVSDIDHNEEDGQTAEAVEEEAANSHHESVTIPAASHEEKENEEYDQPAEAVEEAAESHHESVLTPASHEEKETHEEEETVDIIYLDWDEKYNEQSAHKEDLVDRSATYSLDGLIYQAVAHNNIDIAMLLVRCGAPINCSIFDFLRLEKDLRFAIIFLNKVLEQGLAVNIAEINTALKKLEKDHEHLKQSPSSSAGAPQETTRDMSTSNTQTSSSSTPFSDSQRMVFFKAENPTSVELNPSKPSAPAAQLKSAL